MREKHAEYICKSSISSSNNQIVFINQHVEPNQNININRGFLNKKINNQEIILNHQS